ncbi:WD40-repeat-containing domain protein [Phlebopus sp. FC_14]|nr:WD40-repeat-containing domain protein [Phlebopus sp. FC_14]
MDNTNLLRSESELAINEARRQKSERTKTLGAPIQLAGKALDIRVDGNVAWIAENTHVAKKIDLETGKILQIYKGHTAPVTCLAFFDNDGGTGCRTILVTGSWDKTIRVWDTDSKDLICTTAAHDDFVKSLFVISSAKLLVSSSSDKTIRFWDLTDVVERKTLTPVGSLSGHTRPVECLAGTAQSDTSATLLTADTMGIIKAWHLEKEPDPQPRWRSTPRDTFNHHRTGVTEMYYGGGKIWTASSDETVQVTIYPSDPSSTKPPPPLNHPKPVRAILPLSLTPLAEPYVVTAFGDVIRLYDVSTLREPEILGEIDAHWHDVTAIKLWMRTSRDERGRMRIEPWIVSASLDGTIRKWRFSGECAPAITLTPIPSLAAELAASSTENPAGKTQAAVISPVPEPKGNGNLEEITEEEERELAELMEED